VNQWQHEAEQRGYSDELTEDMAAEGVASLIIGLAGEDTEGDQAPDAGGGVDGDGSAGVIDEQVQFKDFNHAGG